MTLNIFLLSCQHRRILYSAGGKKQFNVNWWINEQSQQLVEIRGVWKNNTKKQYFLLNDSLMSQEFLKH